MTRTHTTALMLVICALFAEQAHGQAPNGKLPSPRDALVPSSPPPQPSPAKGGGSNNSLPPGGGGLGWGGSNLSNQGAHSLPASPQLLQPPGSAGLSTSTRPKEEAP